MAAEQGHRHPTAHTLSLRSWSSISAAEVSERHSCGRQNWRCTATLQAAGRRGQHVNQSEWETKLDAHDREEPAEQH
jgi:hypothetical protein